MDWIFHRPLLAIGLGLFLAAFVLSRVLANGLVAQLDDAQKLRLLDGARRGPGWLIAFVACAVTALLAPRLGIITMAAYFAIATGVRLAWLRRQALPPAFTRRAAQSGWVLVAGFVALAAAVQF